MIDTSKVCLSLPSCWERRPHPNSRKVSHACIWRTTSATGAQRRETNLLPEEKTDKQYTHHRSPSSLFPASTIIYLRVRPSTGTSCLDPQTKACLACDRPFTPSATGRPGPTPPGGISGAAVEPAGLPEEVRYDFGGGRCGRRLVQRMG